MRRIHVFLAVLLVSGPWACAATPDRADADPSADGQAAADRADASGDGPGRDAATDGAGPPDRSPLDADADPDPGPTASVSGDAIPFDRGPDGRIEGATVSILEYPEKSLVTGADGHFEFTGLPVGSEVTLVLEHPDYHLIQTGTHVVPPEGLERITFQAVSNAIYAALAAIVQVEPDEENRCQMVTTVTRVGRSIYDEGAHGEADVVVTLEPPLPEDSGPIYFNVNVVPDRTLTRTSEDGGVLFSQVPPGEYLWTATKAGVAFTRVKMKCRVGVLVNASPPWGLQALP